MEADHTVFVNNPAGTLTEEIWDVMNEAVAQAPINRTKISIDGEEDLITLVAVLSAPEGSFVVYGQPREGMVVIKVTSEKKAVVRRFVEEMDVIT
jgi:uncharacterized protein (UPF0218 family)